MSSTERNLWTGTLLLVCQVKSPPQRRRILSIQGTNGAFLETVQGCRCRDGYANTLDLFDLNLDGVEAGGIAQPRQDVEEQVAGRRIVSNGRLLPEQIFGTNVIHVRIIGVSDPECVSKPLNILRGRPDKQIDVLGGSYQAVEPHRRRANQHVLQSRRFEGPQDANELVSIHAGRVSRRPVGVTCGRFPRRRQRGAGKYVNQAPVLGEQSGVRVQNQHVRVRASATPTRRPAARRDGPAHRATRRDAITARSRARDAGPSAPGTAPAARPVRRRCPVIDA